MNKPSDFGVVEALVTRDGIPTGRTIPLLWERDGGSVLLFTTTAPGRESFTVHYETR